MEDAPDADVDSASGADLLGAEPERKITRLTVSRLSAPKAAEPKAPSPRAAAATRAIPKTAPSTPAAPKKTAPKKPAPKNAAPRKPTPRKPTPKAAQPAPGQTRAKPSKAPAEMVLRVTGLTKAFDQLVAVNAVNLEVPVGSFYGIVGPNGAGKTTTLSMITGLLRPGAGSVVVHGANVWEDPVVAKRNMGVLPDRLRLFDKLTGAQLLYYGGILRGLDAETVRARSADLAESFGIEDSLGRLVSDYSAGMAKKIAIAAAMIHSPRLLVLDEPFDSMDPVSAASVTRILKKYAEHGGTVVLSSHSMDLVQRICDNVAVIVKGVILADGPMAEVRGSGTLEARFLKLVGARRGSEGLEWLHSFSD